MADIDNSVENVAVAVVGDWTEFFEGLESGIDRAERKLSELESSARLVLDRINQLSQTEQRIAFEIAFGDKSPEELEREIKDLAKATGESVEEIQKRIFQARDLMLALKDEYMGYLVAMAESLGATMDEEVLQVFESTFMMTMMHLGQSFDEFMAKVEKQVPAIAEVSVGFTETNRVFKETTERLEEMGIAIPFKKLEQFKDSLFEEARAAREAGATHEELAGSLNQLGDDFVSNMQKPVSGIFDLQGAIQGLATKVVAALAAAELFKKAWQFTSEAMDKAQKAMGEALDAIVALEAYQRATGDYSVTIKDVNALQDNLIAKYRLSATEAREVTKETLLLTRELDLEKDQLFELSEAATVFGKLFDKDVTQVLSYFTEFMQTGQASEELRNLGIQLDEQRLYAEAVRREYIELGEQLDDTTKKMVGLEIIMEEANEVGEDYIKTGQDITEILQDQSNKSERLKEDFGRMFLPLKTTVTVTLTRALEFVVRGFQSLFVIMLQFTSRIIALFKSIAIAAEGLDWKKPKESLKNFGQAFTDNFDKIYYETVIPAVDLMTGAMSELDDSVEESADNIGSSIEGMSDESIAATERLGVAFDKLRDKVAERSRQIDDWYKKAKDNLEVSLGVKEDKAYEDYLDKLQKIDQRANEQRLKVQINYQNRIERLKQNHLIDMKRMEEDYIWDLEDAVRERDARRILELQRQYNRERKRAEEDHGLEVDRLKEDFQLRMEEIERQRQLQREEAEVWYQERLATLTAWHERERDAIEDEYNERLVELRDFKEEELRRIAEAEGAKYNLSEEGVEALYQLMKEAYGAGGFTEEYVKRYNELIMSMLPPVPPSAAPVPINPDVMSYPTSPIAGISGGSGITGRQRGGRFFATGETLLKVGEIPEVVDITPMSMGGGRVKPGFEGPAGGANGRLGINISLDEGLVARVVDRSMNEFANVALSITRGRGRKNGL